MNWNNLLGPVVSLVAIAIGSWFGHRITSPKDHERAALLSTIAQDAAAFIVALNPTAPWDQLLKDLIARISAAAGLPTSNLTAIENAAAAALTKLGKSPTAK